MTDLQLEPESVSGIFPRCKVKGKAVTNQTVKAMISGSLRTIHDDTDYYFCRTQSCPEVCFSSDGQQTFNIDEIREHVYQKEPDCPYVLMCYCFQYSVEDIKTAGDSVIEIILTDINTGIKNGQCACDLRNPQGSCCLGNIQKLIRRLE